MDPVIDSIYPLLFMAMLGLCVLVALVWGNDYHKTAIGILALVQVSAVLRQEYVGPWWDVCSGLVLDIFLFGTFAVIARRHARWAGWLAGIQLPMIAVQILTIAGFISSPYWQSFCLNVLFAVQLVVCLVAAGPKSSPELIGVPYIRFRYFFADLLRRKWWPWRRPSDDDEDRD